MKVDRDGLQMFETGFPLYDYGMGGQCETFESLRPENQEYFGRGGGYKDHR